MRKLNKKKKKIINLKFIGNNILYSLVYTFICLVSHFNTLELFCLQIQFYSSIPFHCIFYTSWESVHGMERLFKMYSVVRCISVYICNRQDKGKCCIVLSFISPLLFQPVLCFFFFYLLFVCKTSLKYEVFMSAFFICELQSKAIDYFFLEAREDFFLSKINGK